MSGDSAVAEISDDGILVAQKAGIALVWAEAQGVRGSARVQIDPADVSAVRISPPPYIEVGDSVEMSAAALGAHAELLHGRVMSWSSNDANIAVVSENGIVGRAAGRVRLTCTCEGKDASLVLTIAPPSAWTIYLGAGDASRRWTDADLAGAGAQPARRSHRAEVQVECRARRIGQGVAAGAGDAAGAGPRDGSCRDGRPRRHRSIRDRSCVGSN